MSQRGLFCAVCAVVLAGMVLVTGCAVFASSGRPVTVDISELPSDDCWWEVGHQDQDGRPGGATDARTVIRCP